MTEKRLGHKQTAAMFTLMRMARAMSNPELKKLVGFTIDGDVRKGLNDARLVASRKVGRSFTHELTDDGWAWCDRELAAGSPPPPSPRSLLAVTLYLVAEGMSEYMRRERLQAADVFGRPVEWTPTEIESRIRTAYQKLARSTQDWVGLVDLRPMLGDAPKADVDAVLKELSRTGQAHLVPEPNRKVLNDADHAAAVRIGGEDNHLIVIEAS
jgi:hypothetical protein